MKLCSPSEFLQRWSDGLRPIVFYVPPPVLPVDSMQLLIEFGLPIQITIHCNNDVTLKFSGAGTSLDVIWKRDLGRGYKIGEMPCEWNRFWHLADQEYLQGGGWLCIEAVTGHLVVIDLDLPAPIYLLNSSVRNFYTTLAYFLDWSERTDGGRDATIMLRDSLRLQNCIPLEELEPYWMNFIDGTLDGDPMRLAVALKPNSA